MALIHRAQLVPSKRELIAAWLPGQDWLSGLDVSSAELVGAFRFDDPAGEVGIETHLARLPDGSVLQVPLTYRAAALPGAEAYLVGTMQHSVLGQRWVYDAAVDPVYLNALVHVIATAGHEAVEQVATESGLQSRPATTHVSGSGAARPPAPTEFSVGTRGTETVIAGDSWVLVVRRVPELGAAIDLVWPRLTGTWVGQAQPVILAELRH